MSCLSLLTQLLDACSGTASVGTSLVTEKEIKKINKEVQQEIKKEALFNAKQEALLNAKKIFN